MVLANKTKGAANTLSNKPKIYQSLEKLNDIGASYMRHEHETCACVCRRRLLDAMEHSTRDESFDTRGMRGTGTRTLEAGRVQ